MARLAYADPPYPGYAHLYPEQTEVDHVELIERLQDYDGWALSTAESTLQYVLSLCPSDVRICAWCRLNAPPIKPNPVYSWEPVLVSPARKQHITARSYFVGLAPTGFLQRDGLTGQKSAEFCDWILRCIGAEPGDELDDLFPGTGIMGRTWAMYCTQPRLFPSAGGSPASGAGLANMRRRTMQEIPGIEPGAALVERRHKASRSQIS